MPTLNYIIREAVYKELQEYIAEDSSFKMMYNMDNVIKSAVQDAFFNYIRDEAYSVTKSSLQYAPHCKLVDKLYKEKNDDPTEL